MAEKVEIKNVRIRIADKQEHHHDGRTFRGGDELEIPEDLAKPLIEAKKASLAQTAAGVVIPKGAAV